MHKFKFPEPEEREGPSKSGRYCRTCGRRISEHKQKVLGRWVCDLVQMDDGHWIHSSRIIDEELKGRKVVFKLLET